MRPGSRHNHTGSASPQMMTNTAGTYRYGVLIKQLDGSVRVWRQDLSKPCNGTAAAAPGTGSESYVYFDITNGSAMGIALGLPIKGGGYDQGAGGSDPFDDHYAFCIGVDSQDRLWIAGNHHAETNSWHCIRSTAANGTWDTTWQNAWVSVTDFTTASGNPRFTYNHMERTSNGTLVWFMSQEEDATATRGRDQLAFYLPPGTGTTWSKMLGTGTLSAEFATTVAVGPQISPGGTEITDPPDPTRSADRVYIAGLNVSTDSSGVEWLHVFGIWRTTDKWGNGQQQPFYVKGQVSGFGTATNWRNVHGQQVTMPLTWGNRNASGATITIDSAPPVCRTYGLGLAIDPSGYPHVIVENGGRWFGPSDPNTPDQGSPVGGQMGVHPSFTNQATNPFLRLWFNGTSWQASAITTGSLGQARGAVPVCIGRHTLPFVICTLTDSTVRISSHAGMNVAGMTRFATPGSISSGSEPNFDPVAARSGELALMIPDYDTPRVYSFGKHSRRRAV